MKHYTNSKHILLLLVTACISSVGLFASFKTVNAQTPTLPEYVVVPNDTLYGIAAQFKTTVEAIQAANGMDGNTSLQPGDHLKIPGLEGLSGVMVNDMVPLGASLTVLARRGQSSVAGLVKLNKITSPSELFIGRRITVTQNAEDQATASMDPLLPGESMLEMAVSNGLNYYQIARINGLSSPSLALPMDTYYRFSEQQSANSIAIPGIEDITLGNMPFKQGEAYSILVTTSQDMEIHSELVGVKPLYAKISDHRQAGFGGIKVTREPGIYPLTMEFKTQSGQTYRIIQYVYVQAGNFAYDGSISVDQATLDKDTNAEEDAFFEKIYATATPVKQWEGQWVAPTNQPICITDHFGNKRIYNNDETSATFHTGLDLGYCMGTDVFAPARGTVVKVLPNSTVRGNVIVIDHGLGVYSTYMHLDSFLINEGDVVEPGQKIAVLGNTGRSNGPHLHFQIDVSTVHVNPETWLYRVFP